jgi:hypothetical protein
VGTAPGPSPSGGGLPPGTGSAAPHGARTTASGASRSETVEAPIGGEGSSEVRTRAPEAGRESVAARERLDAALELIDAEEEALYAEPLPLSRREQVLRYFQALRQRLEAAEGD